MAQIVVADVERDRSDSVGDRIGALRSSLMHTVEIEYGLLDILLSSQVVTAQQTDVIRSKITLFDQLTELIDNVVKSSSDIQEQFLTALEQDQQSHVAVYIRANGLRPVDNPDNWPVALSEKHLRMLDRNRPQLIDWMDSRNGLLDQLFSVKCISSQQKQQLEADGVTDRQRNARLCLILRRRSVTDFKNFICCLARTKQHQVLSLLDADSQFGDDPLSDVKRRELKRKYPVLITTIDANSGVLSSLLANDIITWQQKNYVQSASCQSDSNRFLLDILLRGSETDFYKFIDCLRQAGQQHASHILSEAGIVAHLAAKININDYTETTKSGEEHIVKLFKALVVNSSGVGRERQQYEVDECCEALESGEIEVIALDAGNSIEVFFLCRSSNALRHFSHLYVTGQMKTIVQQLFNILMKEHGPAAVSVSSLEWDSTNYNEYMSEFCLSINLPELSTVYRLASQTQHIANNYGYSSLRIQDLPSRVIDLLILKTAGLLFITINRKVSRAEIYTLVTLCAVSMRWQRTLTGQKDTKQRLKRFFNDACYPFKSNTQQLPNVRTAEGRNVRSMAEINGKLYVACYKSNVLDVFNSTPPFGQCEGIEVRGMINPIDIVACSETNQLFIADSDHRAVWRVDLSRDKDVMQLITLQWMPFCMSIKSRRVLLTPYVGATLHLFSDEGSELNQIELPRYMQATHAIETTNKTFLVCYLNRWYEDKPAERDSVSEVDISGRVIRRCDIKSSLLGMSPFNVPRYLVADVNDHVIVADTRNERIVLLTSDLQFKRILAVISGEKPVRLCISRESGLIFGACLYSTNIFVYKCLQGD